MNTKKVLLIIIPIVVILIAGTAGLSYYLGQSNSTQDVATGEIDKSFIKDMEKNIKNRNKLNEEIQSDPTNYNEQEFCTQAVESENSIYEYENATFDNPRLEKLSKDYIDGLNKQKDAITYYSTDYTKFYDLWNEGYYTRSVAIISLVDEFNLDISDEMKNEFNNTAKIANEKTEQETAVKALFDSIVFTASKTEGNYTTYTAIVENTTPYSFEYLSLNINLISNDVILETAYDNISNWKSGEKAQFEFMTNNVFDRYTIDGDYTLND